MKRILTLAVSLCLFVLSSAQVKAVEKFVKDYPELQKYYVYQSTLRMINQEGNENFNRLIKDIRKINVYVEEGATGVTKDRYDKMIDDLYKEDFEVLINAKYQGTTYMHMMTKEVSDRSYYVLTVRDTGNFALMEMDGSLDLKYIQALENLNFDELVGMVINQQSGDE